MLNLPISRLIDPRVNASKWNVMELGQLQSDNTQDVTSVHYVQTSSSGGDMVMVGQWFPNKIRGKISN